jgi:endonuclease/exonuclease/phosphatase family metal-dependent hydrolase
MHEMLPFKLIAIIVLLGTACRSPLGSGAGSPAAAGADPVGLPARAPQVPASPVVIRVLTYNIRHGEGRDRVTDLIRTSEVMKSVRPDIIALQEVDRLTERSGRVDQVAELAKSMGMHAAYGKAIDHDGGEYGVAVLSRWPLEHVENHPLPSAPGTEQRTALTVRVRAGENGPLMRFTSTHLSTNWEPENTLAQASRLNELLTSDDVAGILAGDINARTETDPMRLLESEWTIAAAAATTGPEPVITSAAVSTTQGGRPSGPGPGRRGGPRSDYVLVRPAGQWRVLEATVIEDNGASDHRPVLSVLEWVAIP